MANSSDHSIGELTDAVPIVSVYAEKISDSESSKLSSGFESTDEFDSKNDKKSKLYDNCNEDFIQKHIDYPFKLHWVFGHQAKIPPVNVSSSWSKGIFFASGSVGVCYDWVGNVQSMFIGHKNDIISIATTPDKKYLASADSGSENSLIIWQTNGNIFFVLSEYFSEEGVIAMSFSSEGKLLMTLTGGNPQELSFWEWKSKKPSSLYFFKFDKGAEFQHYVVFHPMDSRHFLTCGKRSVYFFEKKEENIISSVLTISDLYDENVCKKTGDFTQTTFTLTSSLAITATTRGMMILWGRPLYSKEKPAKSSKEWFVMDPRQRVCIRMLQAMTSHCSIPYLGVSGECIVAGTGQSEIYYYDENFSTKWFLEFNEGPINGISFNFIPSVTLKEAVLKLLGKEEEQTHVLEKTNFIVCTSSGYVGYIVASTSEVTDILRGTSHYIRSVAVHPIWSFIFIGDYDGGLQKWNYKTKQLINKESYKGPSTKIEYVTIDSQGSYVACAMSNGCIVIFNAVRFSAQPCFVANEVLHRPTMMKFAPDAQHLLITDAALYITRYRLHLLVPPKIYQMMKKDKKEVPPEKPIWAFGGKTRQHQGRIVDCMFNKPKKDESLFFYTLGEDRYLVQYNITNSRGVDIEVSKRMILERKPVPICMTWYPLYHLSDVIAVISDDGKLRVYNLENEKLLRIVTVPSYEEPIKRILLLKKKLEYGQIAVKDLIQYFVFHSTHIIGLTKFPIDGNPNTSLGMAVHPSGIKAIVPNKDQTFLFTAGSTDSWIYMHEINLISLLEAEKQGGEGIDAFKYLFPSNKNPDEMKDILVYSVYAIELEMKMLKFGVDEDPELKGEIPVNFLEYVLAALGCFMSSRDLQMMLNDIQFENQYMHDGKKTTLSCLDIIKLYVNYRPQEPITDARVRQAFRDILAEEDDPDQIPRARFLDILATQGDSLSQDEFLSIINCLRDIKPAIPSMNEDTDILSDEEYESLTTDIDKKSDKIESEEEESASALEKLIPEVITEEIFFRDILCLETDEEDLSGFILKREDYKFTQELPTLEDFVSAVEKNNLWE